ncbi:MAG: helix-turn-helix domain-containing protein [Bacteroides cellulosilyticus]
MKKQESGRSALFKKIKTLIGISTDGAHQNVRLKKAAELIREGSDNFTRLAYKTGLRTAQHFSKCFKMIYGVTPTEYKKISVICIERSELSCRSQAQIETNFL